MCVLIKDCAAASFYLAEKKKCSLWVHLLIFEFLHLHFHMYFSFSISMDLIQLD